MTSVSREIPLLDYSVRVEAGLLGRAGAIISEVAPAHRYAIVTDETIAALHLDALVESLAEVKIDAPIVVTVAAGESSKTRESWAHLTDALFDAGCGRDTTIIALGGGVVGDLAGFVAATYMRGVPWVQIPTTLLAMVDASIGGKTGIDLPAGKNLVGAFHQPRAVLADVALLETLPVTHLRNGMAEVLKHGIIASERHLADALALAPSLIARSAPRESVAQLVADSVAIKASVVAHDEREGGVRKILNFGHTIGHAVEAASEYSLLHGEAIAIGMALESVLAERLAVAEAGVAVSVLEAMTTVGLPTRLPPGSRSDVLLSLMRSDKKARAGRLEFSLPHAIGRMAGASSNYSIAVDEAALVAVLEG